jgi:hypothetical protein
MGDRAPTHNEVAIEGPVVLFLDLSLVRAGSILIRNSEVLT